ncbi:uncharacterized protein A4U43_C05F1700 [Asparagus officinalis]|uniref:UBC core domain-containing protein n=1 Tax=Asparagus officinalis TaxID=4686 RepID=A0A5P1EPL7_ASPOF|nr:ubiquitin-conjugating enzyme E2 32 [Asparagus officinalis]ONK67593.1 uncharacterized protein A4U43_C05F1700 [Asparagus officinalis]
MAEKHNMKNPAVKRILQEVKEMQSNPSDDFMSLPLEEDIFEWQFAIRGPRDTEFEGGIFHGRIQLPTEYPFKPPSFMLLTPNGRFETQTKICLSISNYHPEHWQPSWSVRTALVALIAFMPTIPGGALGSLDYSKEERRKLAIKSREAPPKYGTLERQKLIDQIHEYMLSKAPPVPQLTSASEPSTNPTGEESQNNPDPNEAESPENNPNRELERRPEENVHELRVDAAAGPLRVSFSAGVRVSREGGEAGEQRQVVAGRAQQQPKSDRLFSVAAFGLAVAIVILLVKKYVKSHGIPGFMEGL